MTLGLAGVLTLILLVRSSSQEECGCCGNVSALISGPKADVLVSANPLLKMENGGSVDPMNVELSESNKAPWCSVMPLKTRAFDPYLTFTFTSTYVIEQISISGDPDDSDRYITALYIRNDTGQGFEFINSKFGTPKAFNASSTTNHGSSVWNISFMDEPVLATSLQIRPFTWTGDHPCMRIELYGCLFNTDSQDFLSNDETVANNSNTNLEMECNIKLITVGIGGVIVGSLITITIGTVIAGIACCCKYIRKRRRLMSKTKKRSSSMDSDATLRVVNNILYHKRRSDKRPLAPSNSSTLAYETVPIDHDSKETTKPQIGESTKESNCELETPNKQPESSKAVPVFEMQYEPVEINNGLCTIPEESERSTDVEQCTTVASNGTMGSHHSYEVIKDRKDAILEASSESLRREIGGDDQKLQQNGMYSEGANGGDTMGKKNLLGTKNAMYENITISMSPDTRHALFCESSGPQHFAV